MGSPQFAVPCLRAVHEYFTVVGVVTRPDQPKGRGRRMEPTPVKVVAAGLGLPVVEPTDVRTPEFLHRFRDEWNPDVAVVVAFGRILPRAVLDAPRLGCVNVHASLLPRHRGASPMSAAILSGDPVTGVTTMVMDEGLDTGDILLQQEVPISDGDTAGTLQDKLQGPAAALIVRTLERLSDGSLTPRPQDASLVTCCPPLKKGDGQLDWRQDARSLSRRVRAMNPWPGTFTRYNEILLKVWEAQPAEGTGPPGMIMAVDDRGIAVGTGDGLLVLKRVQAQGKKRVSAPDFFRGSTLNTGDRFEQGAAT